MCETKSETQTQTQMQIFSAIGILNEETDPFKDTSYFRPVIIHILQLLFHFQSCDWGVGAMYE